MEHSALRGGRLLIARLDSSHRARVRRLLEELQDGPEVANGPIEIAIKIEKNDAKATVPPGTALKSRRI